MPHSSLSRELFIFHEFVCVVAAVVTDYPVSARGDQRGCSLKFLVSVEACFGSKYVVHFGESSMSCGEEVMCLGEISVIISQIHLIGDVI